MSSGRSHSRFLPRHPVRTEMCYPFYLLAASVHTPLRNEKTRSGVSSETHSVMRSREELETSTSESVLTSQSGSWFVRFATLAENLVVPL